MVEMGIIASPMPRPRMEATTAISSSLVSELMWLREKAVKASTAILTTILLISLHAQGAPSGSTVTTAGLGIGYIVGSFSDAFMVMSIVACVGIAVAFFLHDDVLDKHWAEQRGAAIQMVEADVVAGGGS